MAQYERHTHEFPPLYGQGSRILILGSFPSVRSREQKFFYGHPRNRFWKILAALTKEPFPETTAKKRDLAIRHGIALWDVIEACDIIGSSDSSIRNVVPTNLPLILDACPIRAIYTNGQLAGRLYMKYQYPVTGREHIGLPSSSPANAAWSLDRLIDSWKVIFEENGGS